MFFLLKILLSIYLVLGLLSWLGVIYIPKKATTVGFALKSLVLLILFWPLLFYSALKTLQLEKT